MLPECYESQGRLRQLLPPVIYKSPFCSPMPTMALSFDCSDIAIFMPTIHSSTHFLPCYFVTTFRLLYHTFFSMDLSWIFVPSCIYRLAKWLHIKYILQLIYDQPLVERLCCQIKSTAFSHLPSLFCRGLSLINTSYVHSKELLDVFKLGLEACA